MRIVGVDPGAKGGIAVLDGTKLWQTVPMPQSDGYADGYIINETLSCFKPDVVVIEDVKAMPPGVVANFKLGYNKGIVIGIVQARHWGLRRLTPREWKKTMGLINKPKDQSRVLATEMWPGHAKDWRTKSQDGRAEAALIAEAYRRTL